MRRSCPCAINSGSLDSITFYILGIGNVLDRFFSRRTCIRIMPLGTMRLSPHAVRHRLLEYELRTFCRGHLSISILCHFQDIIYCITH